ncbi:unnamed protein product, partial [Mesorhabditis belari]
MQAAIALCHFCETHGPRVVITCQPIRDASNSQIFPENSDRGLHSPCEPSTSGATSPTEPPKYYGDNLTVVEDPDARCDACTSLGTTSYLLSNDHLTRTSYISSQVAFSEIVLDRIRTSCLRSLSYEISIPQLSLTQKGPLKDVNASSSKTSNDQNEDGKDDGNIFYGDSEHGYTFALTFRIPDTKARGLQRLYSLLVVSNDPTFLLNSHDFFLQALRSIKDKLRSLAMETFRRENQQMREAEEPLRPENASRISRLPPNLISRRISLDTKRTLQTITGDEEIWIRLHR